jgi:hypothetical protein
VASLEAEVERGAVLDAEAAAAEEEALLELELLRCGAGAV